MKNKIKIALCYSGAVRGLINNLEHLKKVLFSQEGYEYNIDYYLYCDPLGASIHQKDIIKGQEEPQGLKVKKQIPEFNCFFEDETIGLEDRMQKFNTLIQNYHMPYKEQVLQWYSVKKVFDFVLSQDKQYDVYVRLRCDLFPAGKMEFDWSSYDENTIYVPFNAPFGGINDRFAFGSKKAMRIYSNFYDSEIYYTAKTNTGNAEKIGKKWYEENYGHVPSNNFRGGGDNSEYRLLLYLLDNNLNIELISDKKVHIGSVRDSDSQIRYPGPDLEKFLIEINGYKKEELKYDNCWWR